ncbi:hypothetical protein ASD24_26660 [Paenibacillus sp. Root52]|uniref:hypothetical protein n=1 Tax=Paenibacillus sp. Root52 TaxID=1736552 RepID=UPI0006FDE687|nr:hypothetical protein [Paenibacillus sp. Root52]KQY87061.1 hypothetical protein ASD24_26660 [Paenibacillus sp. Root52]
MEISIQQSSYRTLFIVSDNDTVSRLEKLIKIESNYEIQEIHYDAVTQISLDPFDESELKLAHLYVSTQKEKSVKEFTDFIASKLEPSLKYLEISENSIYRLSDEV